MNSPETERARLTSYPARFAREAAARPAATGFSIICIILFILQARGTAKIDGYGIALLVLAAIPWSVETFGKIAEAVGEALGKANIRSLQIWGIKIEQIEKELDEQRRILDDLILYSMAFHIYDKLMYLHLGSMNPSGPFGEHNYVDDEPFIHDLRYLRDHGYLEHFQISELVPGQNLVGRLKVTEMGQRFVNLKQSRGLRTDSAVSKAER
jgi:hypothetical protein